MNGAKTLPEVAPTKQEYLLRVENTDVVFVPIKTPPNARNFYIVSTLVHYKWNGSTFAETCVTGTLALKHGENTQKLEGFRAKTLEALLQRIDDRVRKHYIRIQQTTS